MHKSKNTCTYMHIAYICIQLCFQDSIRANKKLDGGPHLACGPYFPHFCNRVPMCDVTSSRIF